MKSFILAALAVACASLPLKAAEIPPGTYVLVWTYRASENPCAQYASARTYFWGATLMELRILSSQGSIATAYRGPSAIKKVFAGPHEHPACRALAAALGGQ